MFKTGVVAFAIIAVFMENALALSDEHRANIRAKFVEVGAECIKDYPITVDDIASLKSRVFPDSDNAGCFSACVFNRVGLFDDKGTISQITAIENAKQIFEDEEELEGIQGFLNTCAKVNDEEVSDGEKGCERAKLAFECFAQNYDQIGFDIEF